MVKNIATRNRKRDTCESNLRRCEKRRFVPTRSREVDRKTKMQSLSVGIIGTDEEKDIVIVVLNVGIEGLGCKCKETKRA